MVCAYLRAVGLVNGPGLPNAGTQAELVGATGLSTVPVNRSCDPVRPVVCLDESPLQLIGEVREPISAAPGQVERVDYEYRRKGMVNLLLAVDAHRPRRKVTVTKQRTARDWERQRNLAGAHLKWMFTTEKAHNQYGPRLSQTSRCPRPARQKVIITVPKN